MKKLILVRHGKSSWDEPVSDKERTLVPRGIKDAGLVSAKLAKKLPGKYLIFSSPAKRAAETAYLFEQNFPGQVNHIIFKDELYVFDEKNLEKVIKSFPDDQDCVILFGHNEAITDFVNKFGDVFIENVPTSGSVIIEFDSDSWKYIKKGKTLKTIFPKDLR